jgi:hypothetical protein
MVDRYKPAKGTGKKLFQKGTPRPPTAGRKPGQRNHITTLLKDAITGAAEDIGQPEPIWALFKNGRKSHIIGWKATGRDGTRGYLRWLGLEYPQAFTGLLARIMPLQINATAAVEHTVKSKFAGVDPSTMTLSELQVAYHEAIGLTQPLPPPKLVHDTHSMVYEGEAVEVKNEAA